MCFCMAHLMSASSCDHDYCIMYKDVTLRVFMDSFLISLLTKLEIHSVNSLTINLVSCISIERKCYLVINVLLQLTITFLHLQDVPKYLTSYFCIYDNLLYISEILVVMMQKTK